MHSCRKDTAWSVRFDYGYGYWIHKSYSKYARAVRGGQSGSLGHLSISAPAQGSVWNKGDTLPITWYDQGISGNVSLSISRQGGKAGTFETLVASTENDGTYDWTVEGPGSVNCMLRIEPVADPEKGTTQGFFSIIDTSIAIPTVTTSAVAEITTTSAQSGGNVTSDGGAEVTSRGIFWSTSENPTIDDYRTSDGTGTGDFTSIIDGLAPETEYHVRAYATNSVGTGYGEVLRFTTSAAIVPPSVTTKEITEITAESAKSGGNVTSDGSAEVTSRGVCWSTSANPTTGGSKTSDGMGTGSFTSNITGLSPGTTYHVRAYATNSAGTAYGSELTFMTSSVAPTVTTTAVSSVTSNSAQSGGNVNSDGGAAISSRGVCWSTSANPTTGGSKTSDGTGTGSFTSNITGLNPGTTYHVRAYATNSAGTAYGSELTFMTSSVAPTVTTTAVSSVTSTSAQSGGNVNSDGGAAISSRGVCWSTSANPTTGGSKTSDGTGTGSFTSNITGLNPGTTYHVRAYATNSAGTAYGSELTFMTSSVAPTVTTTAVSSVTSNSAQSGGNVNSDGGAAISSRGVCWSTSANSTTGDNKTSDGTGTGSFTSNITGLNPGTTYHVRAYATNSAGTAYGSELTFMTSSVAPTVTTTAVSSVTSNSAQSGGNVNSDGGAAISSRGVCWSKSENPTIADSKTANGTGTGSFVSAITGLNPGTPYYVRAYATNIVGTAYGEDISFTTLVNIPAATTDAAEAVTSDSAVLNGTVNPNGAETTVSFEWGTDTSYGGTVTAIQSPVSGTEDNSVSADLTGLLPGTTYHFRVKATNSEGTAYGEVQSFLTPAADISIEKSADKLNPAVDENVVFTITVQNNGPSDVTGLQVTDILSGGLTYVNDTSGGTYDPATGIWDIGSLSATPPDNIVNLDITATVTQEGETLNIASITYSDLADSDTSNNSSALILNGPVQADLGISKVVNDPMPSVGDNITFTITLTNNGLDNATALQMTDLLSTDLIYQSYFSEQGTYSPDTGVWDVGDLNTGESAILNLTAAVNSSDEIINTASINQPAQTDPDITNNRSSNMLNRDLITHPFVVDLAIQKRVNKSSVNVGEQVVFTVVVRNNGPDYTEDVEILDLLPAGLTYQYSVPSQGIYDDQTGIWQVGTIPYGTYALMYIAAVLDDSETVTNTATVSSTEGFDVDSGNDSDSVTVTGTSIFGPDIKANGSDGPVVVSQGEFVSIGISLNAGDKAGQNADWWVAVNTPFAPPGDWYTFVYPGLNWLPGVNLCAQTGLFDLAPYEVLNMTLPVGTYTFYFALDDPDGMATGPWWGPDSVEVIVQ